MRMDDNIGRSASPVPAAGEEDALSGLNLGRTKSRLRFTSNVVGSLFVATDLICFILSVPITLAAYSVLRGSRLAIPVHVTAFILMMGSFLLIRMSRQAYRRSLLDLRDSSDTTFDAVISQPDCVGPDLAGWAGEDYSRGVSLLFLFTLVLLLSSLAADPPPADHPACEARSD